jgi:hypothetical protein
LVLRHSPVKSAADAALFARAVTRRIKMKQAKAFAIFTHSNLMSEHPFDQ